MVVFWVGAAFLGGWSKICVGERLLALFFGVGQKLVWGSGFLLFLWGWVRFFGRFSVGVDQYTK